MDNIKLLIGTAAVIIGLLSFTKTDKNSLADERAEEQKVAYFASGCFWCVEAIFESVKGVKEVYSGYSGGTEKNPTYEQVAYGRTHHAEAVEVYYDPGVISFTELVQVFFGSHDPTTLNRQGPDRGAQYRSIAFYKNEKQKKIITSYIAQLESKNICVGKLVCCAEEKTPTTAPPAPPSTAPPPPAIPPSDSEVLV